MEPQRSIIFFDGYCVLCSRSVRFVYRNDPRGRFSFATLESELYRRPAGDASGDSRSAGTGVLYRDGKMYVRSAAALQIARGLRFPWPLAVVFFVVPRFLRDAVYDRVARNRYRWFGRLTSCFVPEGGLKERFAGTGKGSDRL